MILLDLFLKLCIIKSESKIGLEFESVVKKRGSYINYLKPKIMRHAYLGTFNSVIYKMYYL